MFSLSLQHRGRNPRNYAQLLLNYLIDFPAMTHIITQAFGSYEVQYLTQAKKTIRNLTGKTNIDRMKVML